MKFDIYKIADNYKLTETERQILEYILKNQIIYTFNLNFCLKTYLICYYF